MPIFVQNFSTCTREYTVILLQIPTPNLTVYLSSDSDVNLHLEFDDKDFDVLIRGENYDDSSDSIVFPSESAESFEENETENKPKEDLLSEMFSPNFPFHCFASISFKLISLGFFILDFR